MSDVFIIHVEEDADISLQVALGLEEAGYTTWSYELDSVVGSSYLLRASQAIKESKSVVLIISPHSLSSHQVTAEVIQAHESGKHFVPLLRDITHVEFQNRQPEWRIAVGSATSIRISQEGASSILPRIIDGLKALNIFPQAKLGASRIAQIRKALDELQAQGVTGKSGRASMPTSQPPFASPAAVAPSAKTAEQAKRRPKWLMPALKVLGAAAALVLIAAVINVLIPSGDGPPPPTPTPPPGVASQSSIRVNVMVEGATSEVIVDGRAYQPTHSIDVTPGKPITLEVKDPPPRSDYREVFFKWSDGGDRRHEVKPESSTNYIAYFKRQYPLKVSSAYGAIEGGGWCDEGTSVTPSVTPTTVEGQGVRRVHTGWTQPLPITMTGPDKVEATWKTQYQLWVSSPYGTIEGGGWYDEGASVTPKVVPTTVEAQGTRRIHTGWSRLLPITMNGSEKVEATWKTQYFLKVSSPYGTAKGEDWYDEGVFVTPSVTPTVVTGQGARNVQTGWSLPLPVTMAAPMRVEATWKSQYMQVNVYANLSGPPGDPLLRNPQAGLQVQTDIPFSRVSVDFPDGRSVTLKPYTDVWSPQVDQKSVFRYLGNLAGMPAKGTYTFIGWDAQGAQMAWNTDVYLGGNEIQPPVNLIATLVSGKGITVSWQAVPNIPASFEPDKGIGNYQINIAREDGAGGTLFGTNNIRTTSYLIPQSRSDFSSAPGGPRELGTPFGEFPDGNYVIRIVAFSQAPRGSVGSGSEAHSSDPNVKVLFAVKTAGGQKQITLMP